MLAQFPFFEQADERLRRELEAASTLVRLAAGDTVFREGGQCDKVVFLGRGEVRITKAGETGRQIVLYRLRPGEACFLNVACVVAGIRYPADAVAESRVEALVVPPDVFLGWFERTPPVRAFVLRMMSERFIELLVRLEDVALTRLDRRLASFLLSRAHGEGGVLHLTHEAIASELGSAREVMRRRLKDLEQRGSCACTGGAWRSWPSRCSNPSPRRKRAAPVDPPVAGPGFCSLVTFDERLDTPRRVLRSNVASPIPTRIFVFEGGYDFALFSPHKRVAGFFHEGMRENHVATQKVRPMDTAGIIRHEYVHFVMHDGTTHLYPPWYSEGFSEFLRTVAVADDQVIIGAFPMDRLKASRYGTGAPFDQIISARPGFRIRGNMSRRRKPTSWWSTT